ncbi:MAG: hypothetical protein NZ838_01545, partial [Candidatus Marinimicrobia bacterium]|nr:hypothetical protein [Candidatus Neomarinimicrobiota bacterium]
MDDGTGTSATNAVSGSPSLSLQQGATWSTFTKSPKPERLADIRSGYSGSYPSRFREYNGKLYFRANDGTNGYELWVYNPADDTTARVTDIWSGSSDGLPWSADLVVYDGKLFFQGNESSKGTELYSYDGSSVTRITDIYSGQGSSYPRNLRVFNKKLYFVAYDNSYGYEWYSYDGSTVERKTDIRSGASDGVYAYGAAKVYNNKLYFSGYDSNKGVELFSYDETNGAQLVKDIYDGSSGSYPSGFTLFDGKLYLTANYKAPGSAAPDNGMEAAGSESEASGSGMNHEGQLLKYDGTDLTLIDLGGSTQYVTLFGDTSVFNKKLYFSSYTSTYGQELWSYDETNGAKMVADSIYPGSSSSYPYHMTAFNNKLYFKATDGTSSYGGSGDELWYYDGTEFGRAGDIYSGTSGAYPQSLFATNDALYFSASENTKGQELWGIKLADPKPTIASITSTTSNGTFKVGDAINITVNFSEAVTLSSGGSLTVTLETGTTDRTVSITSISNATSASGTYTVQSGDVSSDLTANSVSVSGSLSDASSQAMDSFTIGSNLAGSSALVIDGVLPTITSVKSTSDNATYSADSKINITVNFSEAVSISSSGTLTVTLETGTTDRDVTITNISSTAVAKGTYTVQSGDTSDDLDVKSIELSSGATLKDSAGNSMSSLSIHADSSLADFNNIKINTTLPGTPTNIVAKNRYGGIGLKWYKESSAAKYYVYRSGDNATFEKLSTEPTDTTF